MTKDEIKKEQPIEDILRRDPAIPTILIAMGMNRVGIPLMRGLSLEDACLEQQIDADEATERINVFLKNKSTWEEKGISDGEPFEKPR